MEREKPASEEETTLVRDAFRLYLGFGGEDLSNATLVPAFPEASVAELEDSIADQVKFVRVARLVYGEPERVTDQLTGLYAGLATTGCSLAFMLVGSRRQIDLYAGVMGEGEHLVSGQHALRYAMEGYFPGTELEDVSAPETARMMSKDSELWCEAQSIACLTGLPAERTSAQQPFVQELDRFIDAMRGERFTLLVLAKPISAAEMAETRRSSADLYTMLSALGERSFQLGTTESLQVGKSRQRSLSRSVARTVTQTKSSSVARSVSTTGTVGVNASTTTGATAGAQVGFVGTGVNASVSNSITVGVSSSIAHTRGRTKTEGQSAAEGQTDTDTDGTADTISESISLGTNSTESFTVRDRLVTYLMDKIDMNIERMDVGQQYGFWRTGVYVACDSAAKTRMAASILHGLYRGTGSELEPARIMVWNKTRNEAQFHAARRALQRFRNPRLKPDSLLGGAFIEATAADHILPTSVLTSRELALAFGLPRRPVPGVSVLEMEAFGRHVDRLSVGGGGKPAGADKEREQLELGSVFHMGRNEPARVALDLDSLVGHVLLCGATNMGKTNTCIHLLESFARLDEPVPFLVVEPVKREYRQLLALPEKVRPAYLTAGRKGTRTLRINPFRFPDSTHVYTHLDRLSQVFNAAFPLYASMPALLDEALRRAYQRVGWNLVESTCAAPKRYPSLRDLLAEIDDAVQEVGYSQQVSSDYKGALGARVRSLTRGIRGEMLCPLPGDETPDELLFDRNCVINLSDIGSPETRSLVMGLLLTRLYEHQQHRQEQSLKSKTARSGEKPRRKLKHVTVFEEAHNILRRVNMEQATESSNLQGMAVQMFSDAIAELRALGEGFVIVDQSPTALDLSAIRHTNTKIVHRLPYRDDRELAGASIFCNEEQTKELGRLGIGRAAVYQNNWLEPVLCAVKESRLGRKRPVQGTVRGPVLTRGDMLELVGLARVPSAAARLKRDLERRTRKDFGTLVHEFATRFGDPGAERDLLALYAPGSTAPAYARLAKRWCDGHVRGATSESLVTAHVMLALGLDECSSEYRKFSAILKKARPETVKRPIVTDDEPGAA